MIMMVTSVKAEYGDSWSTIKDNRYDVGDNDVVKFTNTLHAAMDARTLNTHDNINISKTQLP